MFTTIHHELGETTPFTPITLDFPYQEFDNIQKIVTPCTCSNALDIRKENLIRVTFTPPNIPVHLINTGTFNMPVAKEIEITFTNTINPGKIYTQKLLITATIKAKIQ